MKKKKKGEKESFFCVHSRNDMDYLFIAIDSSIQSFQLYSNIWIVWLRTKQDIAFIYSSLESLDKFELLSKFPFDTYQKHFEFGDSIKFAWHYLINVWNVSTETIFILGISQYIIHLLDNNFTLHQNYYSHRTIRALLSNDIIDLTKSQFDEHCKAKWRKCSQ